MYSEKDTLESEKATLYIQMPHALSDKIEYPRSGHINQLLQRSLCFWLRLTIPEAKLSTNFN